MHQIRPAHISTPHNRITVAEEPSPPTALLEVGDVFVLPFDRSLLALDYIVFDGLSHNEFEFLFPNKKVLLVVPGATVTEIEVSADRQNKALIKKGLQKQIALDAGFVTLRVSRIEPLTYELVSEPAIRPTDFEPDDLSLPFTVESGWEFVLNDFRQGKVTTQNTFTFHEEACALNLCKPLDKLISLAGLPDFVPYPHQVQAVKAVLGKFRGRALLCDEVGLGKTIEACLVLLEYLQRGLAKRVLILCPPSLTGQWQEELRRKFGLDFVIQDEARFEGWDKHKFLLASLATAKLSAHHEALCREEFDLIIVDEAHHLRNRNTKAWQLVNSLKKRYILLLTATPIQNGLNDIYNLVTLLKPGHLKTYGEFRRKFVGKEDEFQPRNLGQLQGLLQKVMVRNKRSHTNIIPSRRHATTIELDLHPEEASFYEQITRLVRTGALRPNSEAKPLLDTFSLQLLQLKAGSSIPSTLPTLTKLVLRDIPQSYRLEIQSVLEQGTALSKNYSAISRKAEALLEILRNYGEKIIVFTRFHETLHFLCDFLKEHDIETAIFHGSMRRSDKEAEILRFKDSCQVLVSSETGGEGRNLQFCHGLINYDVPWNPMKIEQRIGRIHRLGQERDVQIFNLAAHNTAESHMLTLLDKKINLFELVVGEMDMILGNLEDDRDFEEIMFSIWSNSRSDAEVAQQLEELGKKLAQAKARYLRSQEFDDQVFGDALTTLQSSAV